MAAYEKLPYWADVKLTGGMLAEIQKKVGTQMLPFQWRALNDEIPEIEKSHCVENFRIAAGESQEKFYGMVFQDSDLAKWLEAVAYQLPLGGCENLRKKAEVVIDLIEKAQMPDGYLNTYFQCTDIKKRWTNLRDCHELYCAGHMMEAAVAWYQATGERKLLDVMLRFAHHIHDVLGKEPGKIPGVPGHEEVELALCRMYDVTGEKFLLDLASYFVDERGQEPDYLLVEHPDKSNDYFAGLGDLGRKYAQHQAPVREQDKLEGHAVRALYLVAGMADVAERTGDEGLLEAAKRLFFNAAQKRMYVTGGVGSTCIGEAFTLDYDLPNDTVYAETCASIALIFAARALLQAERDGRYGDVMERALYNTCLAGMNVTQDAFFYVNPLSVVPESSHEDPTKKHVLPVRPGWFGCSCCPPNLARLLGSLGQYVCGTAGNEVRVHLYVDGEMQLETDKGPVKLTVHTDYPRTGEISISVSGECDLALRLPDWCHGSFELTMDKGEYAPKVEKGYLLMPGLHGETQILLTLPMKLRRVYAHSAVRADAGKVAIMRGPVVFCAEEADNGKNLHLLALPRSAELTAVWDGQLLGGAWRIKANALRQQEDGGDAPLYTDEAPKLHPAQISLIPYHLWANRGEGEMEVWLRETLQGC